MIEPGTMGDRIQATAIACLVGASVVALGRALRDELAPSIRADIGERELVGSAAG